LMTIPFVFLDANILLPQYLRVVMLDLADAGLLIPHWSLEVLGEVRRNLHQFGVESAKAEKLVGGCLVWRFRVPWWKGMRGRKRSLSA
jgi:hypothetical protein